MPVSGRLARVKGCGCRSRRRGVVGGADAVCARGGQSALSRGPQLGFRISMGDGQSPLLSKWGNWGGDSSNLGEGRGLTSSKEAHSSSPGTAAPCQQSLNETPGGTAAGSPGRRDTLHSCHAEGHPPPPQLLGEGIND